jgi:hypothetical protein
MYPTNDALVFPHVRKEMAIIWGLHAHVSIVLLLIPNVKMFTPVILGILIRLLVFGTGSLWEIHAEL